MMSGSTEIVPLLTGTSLYLLKCRRNIETLTLITRLRSSNKLKDSLILVVDLEILYKKNT